MLTKLEELVLLTVLRLENDAYGISVYKTIQEYTGKKLAVGSVYFPLERLTKKGYLEAHKGEPTPERGGMSKRFYRLTFEGKNILRDTLKINQLFWKGIPSQLGIDHEPPA